jgi:hypothetical protein
VKPKGGTNEMGLTTGWFDLSIGFIIYSQLTNDEANAMIELNVQASESIL